MRTGTAEHLFDFQEALGLTGLPEARFRYLEKEFGASIGIRTHFFLPARYTSRQIGLLMKLERVLADTDRPAREIRETIRSYLDVRRRGIWTAAVTSGKGGVGKTSLAVNISVSLSRLGVRPMVVDADLGTANAHLLLGALPERSLPDLLRGESSLEEIITGPAYGVRLVPGGSGSRELADLDEGGRERLARELEKLRYLTDSIIIDTGSGISENVLRFLSLADDILVVVTPNIASCVDALGLVRAASERGCRGRIGVLVNRCRSRDEAHRVFERFAKAVRRLTVSAPAYLGFLPEDHRIEEAYLRGMPVTSFSPACAASRSVRRIAGTVLSLKRTPRNSGNKNVFHLFERLAEAG